MRADGPNSDLHNHDPFHYHDYHSSTAGGRKVCKSYICQGKGKAKTGIVYHTLRRSRVVEPVQTTDGTSSALLEVVEWNEQVFRKWQPLSSRSFQMSMANRRLTVRPSAVLPECPSWTRFGEWPGPLALLQAYRQVSRASSWVSCTVWVHSLFELRGVKGTWHCVDTVTRLDALPQLVHQKNIPQCCFCI